MASFGLHVGRVHYILNMHTSLEQSYWTEIFCLL